MSKFIDSVFTLSLTLLVAVFMLWGCAPQIPPSGAGYGYGQGYGGGYGGGPSVAYAPAPGGAGMIAVPSSSGLFCRAPEGTLLEIDNDSDYLVEVQSDQVAPLSCDGPRSLVPARVIGRDGVEITILVIPAYRRAKYVFLVLSGGMSNVRVTYTAYLNLGPFAPAPAFKFTKRTYEPTEWPNGIHQDIASGDLRGFSMQKAGTNCAQAETSMRTYVDCWDKVPNVELLLAAALSRSSDRVESLATLMERYSISGKNL